MNYNYNYTNTNPKLCRLYLQGKCNENNCPDSHIVKILQKTVKFPENELHNTLKRKSDPFEEDNMLSKKIYRQ
jgi:hypothetical protein